MRVSEAQRVSIHRSRARKLGMPATLTLADWEQAIADFNGLCAYCQTRPFTILEHYLPIEVSGTHVNNCIPACAFCNIKKQNKKGEALVMLFGKATIEHIECYLSSRKPLSVHPAKRFRPQQRRFK